MSHQTWRQLRDRRSAEISGFDEALHQARLRLALGEFVYELRMATGMTQTGLATRMGTSPSAIDRLEGGGGLTAAWPSPE